MDHGSLAWRDASASLRRHQPTTNWFICTATARRSSAGVLTTPLLLGQASAHIPLSRLGERAKLVSPDRRAQRRTTWPLLAHPTCSISQAQCRIPIALRGRKHSEDGARLDQPTDKSGDLKLTAENRWQAFDIVLKLAEVHGIHVADGGMISS